MNPGRGAGTMTAMPTPLLCLIILVVSGVLYFVPAKEGAGTKVNTICLVSFGAALLAYLIGPR
jgi:hypothetical protein